MRKLHRHRRIHRVIVHARRSTEGKRIAQVAAPPVAAVVAILWFQFALLARDGDLTLAGMAPIIWQAIVFVGVLTAVGYWYSKQL